MKVRFRLAIDLDRAVLLPLDRPMPCLRRTCVMSPLRPGDGKVDLVNGHAITTMALLPATGTVPPLLSLPGFLSANLHTSCRVVGIDAWIGDLACSYLWWQGD